MMMRSPISFLISILLLYSSAIASDYSYSVGKSFGGRYFSSGCQRDPDTGLSHWYAGSYSRHGCLARSDEWGNWWDSCWRKAQCHEGHESISGIRKTVSGNGIDLMLENNVATINAGWPPYYDFQEAPSWWGKEYPWALGGPEAENNGWVGLSDGRPGAKECSCLATWDFYSNRWACFTPKVCIDDTPLVIWDATSWNGNIIIGASIGNGQYKSEWAGRLAILEGGVWKSLPLPPMGGVIRLLPDGERLIITTVWGQAFETKDLLTYTKLPYEDYGANIFVLAYDDNLIFHSSRGKVWVNGELVIDIPNVEFLSLAICGTPDGKFRLGGPITLKGESFSRSFIAFQKEERDD